MLKLMEWAISTDKVETEGEYCEKIGFTRNNLSNIKKGHQAFTREHMINACTFTGANANWILGIEVNMMRKPAKKAIDLLREAFISVEAELQK